MAEPLSIACPAKVNLFLAVTGRRSDGFHDLVSLVAKLQYADHLTATRRPAGSGFTMACDDPTLSAGDDNLVIMAARAFQRASGWAGGAHFELKKRIPSGAGLGGGSSDAAGALRLLNEAAGHPLSNDALAEVAADVGSDCPLFLRAGPVTIRGRGEHVEGANALVRQKLSGQRVIVFKPTFGINTAWAYRQLAARAPATYAPATDAETLLRIFGADPGSPLQDLLFNSFEQVAFAKYLSLPTLLDQLRQQFRLPVGMSGSGSACFALLSSNFEAEAQVIETIRAAWGDEAWVVATRLEAECNSLNAS